MNLMRQPEEGTTVYELGHFEQMVVDKALMFAATGDSDYRLTAAEKAVASSLRTVFAHHGIVSVIRKEPVL